MISIGQFVDALDNWEIPTIMRGLRGGLGEKPIDELKSLIQCIQSIYEEKEKQGPSEDDLPTPDSIDLNDADEFAQMLVDKVEPMRALLGLTRYYCTWTEVDGGNRAEAKGRRVNDILADADRAVSNITSAMDLLASSSPKLVQIVDSPASDKPGVRSQKTYRLTRAGLLKAKSLIEGFRNHGH